MKKLVARLQPGRNYHCLNFDPRTAAAVAVAVAVADPQIVEVDLEMQVMDLFFEETLPSSLKRKVTRSLLHIKKSCTCNSATETGQGPINAVISTETNVMQLRNKP